LANPSWKPNLKLLSSAVTEILWGTPQFLGAPLAQGSARFSSGCDIMMGLGKPKLCTKFQVVAEILKGNPQILGSSLAQSHTRFFFWWDLVVVLGKLQPLAKFEVSGFIYYGNIREFVFKRQIRSLSHPLGELRVTYGLHL